MSIHLAHTTYIIEGPSHIPLRTSISRVICFRICSLGSGTMYVNNCLTVMFFIIALF